MKAIRWTLWVALITTATAVCRAQNTDPGWFRVSNQGQQPLLSRDDMLAQLQGVVRPNGLTPSQPATAIAEVVTPQIQALADGLQNDPVRIFNYVHDHIKFVLYFGSKKGAQLTLLEKSGNDFDQAALLYALLWAAGCTNAFPADHSMAYRFAWVQVPYDDPNHQDYDLRHWWRLTFDNTNWTNTCNYLYNLCAHRGYPLTCYVTDGNSYEFQHVWVSLALGGRCYELDPSFKISEPIAGLTLTNFLGDTATGISNALVNAAEGTSTANYVSGLSEVSVRSKLTHYTTNLLNGIQNNTPNYSVPQVLGGWQIVPAKPSDYGNWWMNIDDDTYGWLPVITWGYQPTNLMSTLSVSFAGTNHQWYVPQLQGQRLALAYDGSGLARLWQEDTVVAEHSTTSADVNVVLSVAHPVGGWDLINNAFIPNPTNMVNQVVTNSYQRVNATYALLYAFEPDWGWLQQRQNKLDAYLQQGLTNGSRQVVSESLNVMGLGWMLQSAGVGELLAAQLGILPQHFHRLGRMAQEAGKGYYVDAYMQMDGEYPSGGDGPEQVGLWDAHFDLWSIFASGLEHGIIEQLQNTNLAGASTVKMLQIASTNGQAIYLANSGNWSSIRGSLSNYGSGVLDQIYSRLINQGYYVLLPANGANHVAGSGSWAGYGFEARRTVNGVVTDSQMIISGGYSGGYASDPAAVVDAPYVGQSGDSQPDYYSPSTPGPTGADPVDLADGTFQVENTDLALGQAEPRGITFSRYYNGTRRYGSAAGMTGGWVHNYCVSAATVAAPQAGLGGTTPAQAAPMIAATTAAIALYNGAVPEPKNWALTALIAKWGVDQLTKGGVSVALGKDTVQFVQQPNGAYTPPANCAMTLTKVNGAYALQTRHGPTFNFDTANRLASIVDPYTSVSNSLVYTASNWVQKVTDWKGRALTFNYTGTPQRLTSVSDGSRTVSYGYSTASNPQGDLVSVTDPESKTSSYAYDTNHQITATLDALSRLVVSNVYDCQGHVATQYTQGDTNKTWRIFWSGWQTTTIDPAGGLRNYYYDDQTRLVSFVDELTNQTDTCYDGQNHILQTVSPLNETNRFVYDGNQNLLLTIDPLGYSNQYFYDSQNNLYRSVDARGNASTFGYNGQFSLTGSTNGAGDWVAFDYNPDGTLHTRTDPGGTNSYAYDGTYGQLSTITYPGSLGSEGFSTSSTGDVLSHTDGRGFVTSYEYNSRRQLTKAVAPTNITVTVAYDAVGNQQSVTDARSNAITSFWSPTRHLTGTVFPSTPQGAPAVTNLYDNRDWLVRTINPQQSTINYSNDLAGRLLSASDPLARTTRFGYDSDGRKTVTTNAAQEVIRQQWNAKGQMTLLTDPATHTVQYAFDGAGNQITLTNRRAKGWQFQYDGANRLTNTITPSLHSTKLAYNSRGLLQTVTPPSTNTATFGYDAKGRQTNRADHVGTTTYQHDLCNNLTNVFENGRTNSWTFDAYNRVSSYRDADGNLIQYRRDQNGNVTNLIYPGNRMVSYSYDSLNRITTVTDWASRQTTLAYDLANHLTSITRPNGTVRQVSYDAAGQATNIVEKLTNNFPIAFFRLNYDNAARVQWEFGAPLPQTNTAPPTRTMTYNDDNQIATFRGPTMGSASAVGYDADGNLTSGPLTNDTFVSYAYDARNRLLSAGGLSYGYDLAGNRTAITNGSMVTKFVANPNANLPQMLMRVRTGVTNYYIYGPGLLYEIAETATTTRTLTYHYDLRGSTIALTDSNGNVTDRVQYSAYGITTLRGGTNDTPFLYNGRYGVMTDPDGLLYMRARYYNPYLSRFINPDPVGFAGGLNWYCYADGNPVSYLDPFGLSGWTPDATSAYNYWMGAAVNGASQGGIIGNAQAAGASVMTSFIDFFGVRNVQSHATTSGNAAGNGNTGTAVLYGAATVGDIGLAALAGWTGGGGAAAKGVGLSEVGWYELGSQTINGDVYRALEATGQTADKVQLGKDLVEQYGWWNTLTKSGELNPTWSDWLQTLPQGPTPGSYLGNLAVRQALESGVIPRATDYIQSWPSSSSSTGK